MTGSEAVVRAGIRARLRTVCDLLIAAAAVVTATAPLLPWCTATLRPDPGASLVGLMAPRGTAIGLYAHPSLMAAMMLAVLQLAVLAARYFPGGRLRVPEYGYPLALGSAFICLIVAADVVLIPGHWADILGVGTGSVPHPWEGTPVPLDGATLVMSWRYGAAVAMAAALASLGSALVLVSVLALTRRAGRPPAGAVLDRAKRVGLRSRRRQVMRPLG
jgi:hypothetical protein